MESASEGHFPDLGFICRMRSGLTNVGFGLIRVYVSVGSTYLAPPFSGPLGTYAGGEESCTRVSGSRNSERRRHSR